ncbi:DUF4007 family protein [Hymenobacter aquaticus]|uniref:DUF4007 family protein n=1 Tax=Hymenobacter aquaticus TaxID=1867101 RepID=A0A4Z0Q6C1_9BACT|nr:DUF4007 family protein [Hymenobacter aquaticus]TGE25204.1 DUF4007 family protein [Hymenobacter aquaticus]
MSLDSLIEEFSKIKRHVASKREKPHKLILLLSVLDLVDEGYLTENKIYFDNKLKSAFREKFSLLAAPDDLMQVAPPYFHLRSSTFWHHKVKEEREVEYNKLTTSGGGSKRIEDNIEYAYFSDDVWTHIVNKGSRIKLQEAMTSVVAAQKLGTAFHEQFKLERNGMSQMLRVVNSNAGKKNLTFDDYKEHTDVGNNKIKSFRNYLKAGGLVNEESALTAFGQAVVEHDLMLAKPETQWVIHYGMSVSHMPGPIYWNKLVTSFLTPGRPISSQVLADEIRDITLSNGSAELAAGTYREAAAVFIRTYSDNDSLGALNILEEENGRTQYTVRQPRALPVGTFACLLADYWERHWPERDDVVLEDITRGELAHVLLLSENKVNDLLGALAAPDMALIKRQRKHLPYQIIRQPGLDAAALWQTHLYR